MMRLFSLYQPWAHAMAINWKINETRGWKSPYRGDVAIQAGLKKLPLDEVQHVLDAAGLRFPKMTYGAVLCVVELYDIVPVEMLETIEHRELALGNYSSGRYAWRTRNLRVLSEPLPCKGTQGFRAVTAELEAQIRSRLKVVTWTE